MTDVSHLLIYENLRIIITVQPSNKWGNKLAEIGEFIEWRQFDCRQFSVYWFAGCRLINEFMIADVSNQEWINETKPQIINWNDGIKLHGWLGFIIQSAFFNSRNNLTECLQSVYLMNEIRKQRLNNLKPASLAPFN